MAVAEVAIALLRMNVRLNSRLVREVVCRKLRHGERSHSTIVSTALVVGLSLSSCASVLKVTQHPIAREKPTPLAGPIKGLPFLAKVPQLLQTTEYVETWFVARGVLSEIEPGEPPAKPDKPVGVAAKSVDTILFELKFNRVGVKKVREAQSVVRANPDDPAIRTFVEAVSKLESDTQYTTLAAPELVKNHVDVVAMLDGSRSYTINAPLPWFGKSTLTGKLAENGTLTEATANVESNPEKLADLVPAKEALTSALSLGAENATKGKGGSAPQATRTLRLEVEEKGYRYVFRKVSDPSSCTPVVPCFKTPLAFATSATEFERVALESDKPKADDDKAIKVNGAISLPK